MLISLEWLTDYVDVSDLKVTELEETLTMLGLEVEGVEDIPAIDDLVVVGKILQTAPHPDAQRLTLCTVDSGEGTREIVCGANNVKPDMLIALAQPGAKVQGQELKYVTIRGKVSQGMICSERELGLGDEHDGILPLDPSLAVGTRVNTVFPTADTVLDVSVTPNRGDCLSYLGIARELQAKLNRPLKPPVAEQFAVEKATEKVKIHIEPDSGCQRFCSLHVQTMTQIPPSPFQIRRRLQIAGIRPINAVVDITNYIMLECGQPLHAYDTKEINDNVIRVKRAKETDKFVSLDGKPRDISAGDILICDERHIIGLAGIIGGENSEIKDDTHEMVIELAHFDDISVRRTAKRLGIHTESSHRFERGTDIGYLPQVALRTRYLLHKNLPPQTAISAQPSDLYPAPRTEKKIAVRLPRVREVLGLPALTQSICQRNLELLSFKLLDRTEERLLFTVPSWRNDIEREIDLIEEIGRLNGLDRIPYELPIVHQSVGIADTFADFQTAVKVRLASLGLRETVNFAMVSPQEYETKLAIPPPHPLYPRLELRNPINDQLQAMQTTLLPNLLRCVAKNRNYRIRGARLFEVGRGYFVSKEKIADTLTEFPHFAYLQEQGVHIKATDRPCEQNLVAGIIDSPFKFSGWQQGKEIQPDIYVGKKLIFAFLSSFGISPREIEVKACESCDYPFLNPFASMDIYVRNCYLGYAGELHPRCLTAFKIEEKVLFFELLLDNIFRLQKVAHANNHTPKYPPVHRDLAFVVPAAKPYREIARAFKDFPQRTHLTDFRLFDIFTDSTSIGEEYKSMAFSVYFSSPERTLTDAEVDEEIANLITWIEKKLPAKLR